MFKIFLLFYTKTINCTAFAKIYAIYLLFKYNVYGNTYACCPSTNFFEESNEL